MAATGSAGFKEPELQHAQEKGVGGRGGVYAILVPADSMFKDLLGSR